MNLPAQTSPQDQSWTFDPETDRIASRANSSLAYYGSVPVLHQAIGFADRERLKERLAFVRRSLMPANGQTDTGRIGRAVAAALVGYGKDQATVAAYTKLLSDLPVWAVERACDQIRRGAASGVNPNYAPPAPVIHQLATEATVQARAERDKLMTLLTAKVEPPRREPTQEERANVQAMVEQVTGKLTGDNDAVSEQRREARRKADEERAVREEHSRRMDYIRQGFEPPTNKHGITMSISLARAMDLPLTKRKPAPPPNDGFIMPADESN